MVEGTAEERKEEAKRALEGPEWTAKREAGEKAQVIRERKEEVLQRLAEIRKKKEALEMAWIDLDNTRKAARGQLNPILDEEKKIEQEEANLESEEARIGLPAEKHTVEQKRWAAQEKRKEIEQKKWAEEEKLISLEKTIAQNTAEYRLLLDEEEKIRNNLDQLDAETVKI